MSAVVEPASTTETVSPPPVWRRGRIQLGPPVTAGRHSRDDVLVAAALAAPAGSGDPVDRTLVADVSVDHDLRGVVVEGFEPATEASRMSVTVVRGGRAGDEPIAIVRGDLHAVLAVASAGPDTELLMRRNAAALARRRFRALAVATARVTPEGSAEDFELLGFVPVRVVRGKATGPDVGVRDEEFVQIPVWSATLRWLHWLNVLAIVLLSITGLYIADPYVRAAAPGTTQPGFLMGWFRLVHYSVAWAWITLGVVRFYLLFFSRDRFVRWPTLWPLKSKQDLRNLGRTVSAYALIHPDRAPTYIGHNPLQQIAYTGVYLLAALQVLTGLTLYGLYNTQSGFWGLFSWVDRWIGIPNVRLLHYLVMWLFFIFVPLHIYLVIRADNIERDGGLSAMVGGSVWIRRGARPVDDPSV